MNVCVINYLEMSRQDLMKNVEIVSRTCGRGCLRALGTVVSDDCRDSMPMV